MRFLSQKPRISPFAYVVHHFGELTDSRIQHQSPRIDARHMHQCIDELMTHWGIDVEAHKTLTRPALPTNLPEVPRMIDYPPMMAQRRLQGVVNIRLGIDERGLIIACRIQMPDMIVRMIAIMSDLQVNPAAGFGGRASLS